MVGRTACFGRVIVGQLRLGTVQEVRAKRIPDRLVVLDIPTARVVRQSSLSIVALADVVLDDLLEVRVGDQVVAGGTVLVLVGVEVDDSRSGSIVLAGSGRYQATAVGAEAYATTLAADARRFTLVHSEHGPGTRRRSRRGAPMR
jgi:cation-transporting ATPase E